MSRGKFLRSPRAAACAGAGTPRGLRGGLRFRRLALEQLEERRLLAASVDELTLIVSDVTLRSDPSSAVTAWTDVVFAVPAGEPFTLGAYNAKIEVDPAGAGIAFTAADIPANPVFPGSVPAVFESGACLTIFDYLPNPNQENPIVDGAGLFRAQIRVAPGASGQFALPLSGVYLFDGAAEEFPADLVGGVLTVLPPPAISIGDVTLAEGDTGSVEAVFLATLSAATEQTVTVNYATADGTAAANEDYQPRSGTLSFAPGELTRTIEVPVLGDALDEPNERFFVNLSNAAHATIGRGQATGTIVDDDPPQWPGLDADGNGTAEAFSDGILILRYLFDPQGQWQVDDALGAEATRTERSAIRAFLEGVRLTCLDADGNGVADPLSDGILILRYLLEREGSWNVADAVSSGATRTTREEIRAHLDLYNPLDVSTFAAKADNPATPLSAVAPPLAAERSPSEAAAWRSAICLEVRQDAPVALGVTGAQKERGGGLDGLEAALESRVVPRAADSLVIHAAAASLAAAPHEHADLGDAWLGRGDLDGLPPALTDEPLGQPAAGKLPD